MTSVGEKALRYHYEQSRWSLAALLDEASETRIAERFEDLERAVAAFEAWRPRLAADLDPAEFVEALGAYEALTEKVFVLSSYGALWFASDTQSEEALAFRNRVENLLTAVRNRTLFFSLWWKGLEDEEAERLLPDGEESADFRHFLLDLRRLKPFTLEERAEQIVNLKDANGVDALLTVYSMLTNRLEFRLEVDGEAKTLTRDEVAGYVFSPRPEVRAAAYRELLRVYAGEAKVLGQIYVHRVRDWHSEHRELRGYETPIAVRNAANDIPDEAVETLLGVAAEHRGIFQRYFRLKARWLGMEKLRRYDIYAPLAESDRRLAYPEAVDLVLDTFRGFHPRFAEQAERVFRDGHIDSEVRKGKRGGAFCATVLPRQTPWLLMNFNGRVRDAATLAHELGHAVHSMMAEDHSVLTQHASLPLAETASVFAEMLLTERLLAEEQDRRVRRELLASAVDDIYGTVLRQAYFVRFEIAAHEAILAGRSLSALNEIHMALLEEQFGDSVEMSPEFAQEWVAIPHIYHSPFYCYAYSFGQLLVLALYSRYREQGEAFLPGYLEMLARGGSARPQEILAAAGVDVGDPGFWRGGFEVAAGLVDDLEALD